MLYSESGSKSRASWAILPSIFDLSVRAIAAFAKKMEFSPHEFNNLVENIVGNYCSQNLSIISLSQLKENLLKRFQLSSNFKLPSIENKKWKLIFNTTNNNIMGFKDPELLNSFDYTINGKGIAVFQLEN